MWKRGIPVHGWRYRYLADHFIVKDWKQDSVAGYLSEARISFYKMFHVTSGKGLLIAGDHNYLLTAGDVAFVQPDETISWSTLSINLEGHFCFVHPGFFKHANHVLEMFLSFTQNQSEQMIVPMNHIQSANLHQSFELMYQESVGNYEDKKQAILIHLQMILLKIRRAGKNRNHRLKNPILF